MSTAASPTDSQRPRQRLLYTRRQASELLGGLSIFSLVRLEQEGQLKPLRLSRSATAQVYYAHEDIIALIEQARTERAKSG